MTVTPESQFHSKSYLAHNAARLAHLATLTPAIAPPGSSVLEVAAGIGDLTPFWLERGHPVSAIEARLENVEVFRRLHPTVPMVQHDLEADTPLPGRHDIVHAYGILYHLNDPARALAKMAAACADILLLETCVSYGEEAAINNVVEAASNPTQAYSGSGCRPTRPWIFAELKRLFPYVYVPRTQPDHAQFPLDWTDEAAAKSPLRRSVFIAARRPLQSPDLSSELLMHQASVAGDGQ